VVTDRIRPAEPHELDAVEALIVRAFADEPFMTWVAGGDRERLAHFVRLAVRRLAVPTGEVLVDPELTTAALVLPSGALDLGPLDQLRQLPDLVRASRVRRLPTVLRGLLRLEAAHPEEPHDTVLTLGVDPAHQGRGRGGAMLRALARRSALPLYLETSSPRSVRFYERHGYTTLREIQLPRGPLVRTMLAR
jgi:ribosomal protein S18 acetylase RimI-like enzyme